MALLPEDFLREASTNLVVDRIDFAKTPVPEYDGLYAVVIDNALSPEECTTLLHMAETTTSGEWERAMVNVGMGRQKLYTDVRNCGRIIWDSHDMVDRIWKRIENAVPEIVRLQDQPKITGKGPMKRKEVWKMTRLNERMRFLRYEGGEYFRPHCDGCYETPDGKERTYFTLHLYLNGLGHESKADSDGVDSPQDGRVGVDSTLRGGSTPFLSMDEDRRFDVWPKTGRILLFQHGSLLHAGDDVVQGVKYTMRTDVLFAKE